MPAYRPIERVVFGPLEDTLADARPGALVVTQPGLEDVLRTRLPDALARAERAVVTSLDEGELTALGARAARARWIVGIGGGGALDAAKHLAWRSGLPLVQIPTILSVDAPFTREIAVRRDDRITYVGSVVPERIAIDLALIGGAPAALNRGGVGDLLSIHTALHDWRLAHERHGEGWDAEVVAASAELLERLGASAGEIRRCSEAGLRLLVELFCEEVALCEGWGSSRPEEGSEHHVLYHLETRLGRTLLHGPAVTLCALIVADLQGNAPERLAELARACGVPLSLGSLGIPRTELLAAVLGAPRYAAERGLPPTFLTGANLDPRRAEAAIDAALAAGAPTTN